jgi:hypothetical protein
MLRRGSAVGLLCVLGLGLGLACASPTLPLPPPEPPAVTKVDSTHVLLVGECGSVESYATVLVQYGNNTVNSVSNQTGATYFANNCGAWHGTFAAQSLDYLEVTQLWDGMTSGQTQFQVPMF